jgi:hypothetical protein
MQQHNKDLRDCATAYDCREAFPELSAWMSDDALKELPLWHGTRFEPNHVYFDLDHPERGAFVTTGDEHRPLDRTYVRRADVPEQVWAQLVTWKQLVSEEQGQAIDETIGALGIGREQSASGEAHPLPPE